MSDHGFARVDAAAGPVSLLHFAERLKIVTRNHAPAPPRNPPPDATPPAPRRPAALRRRVRRIPTPPATPAAPAALASPAAAAQPVEATLARRDARRAKPRPDAKAVTNRQLLAWMFEFLSPVKPQVFFACLWLALFCAVEVLTVRQSGDCGGLHPPAPHRRGRRPAPISGSGSGSGDGMPLRASAPSPPRSSTSTRPRRCATWSSCLVVLTAALLALRYLTTVSRTKMSMSMVYYIREAVYDKLQRVGFGFHDAVSSGQLINRALSDLQNVRAFVQTAVLTTLEIVLVVVLYIALIAHREPVAGAAGPGAAAAVDLLHPAVQQEVQPVAKAVMEAEDKNVSILTENIAGVHVVKAFATEGGDRQVQRQLRHVLRAGDRSASACSPTSSRSSARSRRRRT